MTQSDARRRVVVTGQGVVTPLGTGVDRFWAALKNGECGIRQVQSFSTEDLYITIAGEVPDFDPRERLQSKQLLLADKYSQYAGCAAQEAVVMSKLEVPLKDKESYRAACIIGSGRRGAFQSQRLAVHANDGAGERSRDSNPRRLLLRPGADVVGHGHLFRRARGGDEWLAAGASTADRRRRGRGLSPSPVEGIGPIARQPPSGMRKTGIGCAPP